MRLKAARHETFLLMNLRQRKIDELGDHGMNDVMVWFQPIKKGMQVYEA